jgi:hypothetical protein
VAFLINVQERDGPAYLNCSWEFYDTGEKEPGEKHKASLMFFPSYIIS